MTRPEITVKDLRALREGFLEEVAPRLVGKGILSEVVTCEHCWCPSGCVSGLSQWSSRWGPRGQKGRGERKPGVGEPLEVLQQGVTWLWWCF